MEIPLILVGARLNPRLRAVQGGKRFADAKAAALSRQLATIGYD
jgi:hypothetical protein